MRAFHSQAGQDVRHPGPSANTPPHAPDAERRSLTRRHALVLAVIGLLAAVVVAATLWLTAEQERRAWAVNEAGQQRMLTQQAVWQAIELARAEGEPGGGGGQLARDLAGTLGRLERAHGRLVGGGGAERDGAAPAGASAALAAHYFVGDTALDPRMRGFLAVGRRLLDAAAPPEGHSAAAAALRTESGALLAALDAAVPLHATAGDGARSIVGRLRLAAALLMLLLLGIEARFVVWPLERRLGVLAARLERQAATDPLTGLLSRRAFAQALGGLLEGAGPGRHVALVVVDLDWFKETNEAQGHAAGDALLCAAAERLRRCARPADLVGRLGGDEFAVALAGLTEAAAAEAPAERLRAALHGTVAHGGRTLRLGATLGVVVAPDDGGAAAGAVVEAEALLRAADSALARARRTQRGTVAVFSGDDRARAEREAAILRAIDDGGRGGVFPGLYAELQPQIRIANGEVTGFEALARWEHPELGRLSPGEFLPLAERAGRMPELGVAVRASAFRAFAAMRAAGLVPSAPPPRIAVNLSAAEIEHPDCVRSLERELAEAGLSPEALEVEITEEVLLDRVSDATRDRLAALRGRGARLALDDFGTGYAGLNQLLRLPLDLIKLDRCFVRGLGLDRRAEEIVRASAALAHGLGLELLAEGVETEDQLALLRELGCDAVQGFLVGRPMPPERVAGWLAEHRQGRAASPAASRVVTLRRRLEGIG